MSYKKRIVQLIMFIIVKVLIFNYLEAGSGEKAVLVHNKLEKLESMNSKVKLLPIRVWGTDDEEDENKIFKTVGSIVMDEDGCKYICDTDRHFIKVFDGEGRYLRTIGRRGRGPGDLFMPDSIAFSPEGDLWVYESGGARMQCFSIMGKSKKIFKTSSISELVGITRTGNLVVNNSYKTFKSRKLISIIDTNGKELRKIGTYHDRSKNFLGCEKLRYTMDSEDNIYVLNSRVPVLRKYALNGKMKMVITIETPFTLPYHVRLNTNGDEIEKFYTEKNDFQAIEKKGGRIQARGKYIPNVAHSVAVDFHQRIYLITKKRLQTEKERKEGGYIIWSSGLGTDRSHLNLEVLNKKHLYRLSIFEPDGRIIAAIDLKGPKTDLYVYGDTLFFYDNSNQQIFEYRIQFKE